MSRNHFARAAAAAVLLGWLTPVAAQLHFGHYAKSYGNSYLGGSATALVAAQAYRSGSYQRAASEMLAINDVRLLGRRRIGARVHAYAWSRGSSAPRTTRATFKVDLAGSRIVDRTLTRTGSIGRFTRTMRLFPSDVRMAVPVGPYWVTLRGNADVGVSAQAYMRLDSTNAYARIVGQAITWGRARASVAYGIRGARVGVDVVGNLANQQLSANHGAHAFRVFGSATYWQRAIGVRLRPWVTRSSYWWSRTWRTTLVQDSCAPVSRTLMRR